MTRLQRQVKAFMDAGHSSVSGTGATWQARKLGVHVSTIYAVRKELKAIAAREAADKENKP